jgi:exonuclease III
MEDVSCNNPQYNYLCPIGTKNFGLCYPNLLDCNSKIQRKAEMQPQIIIHDDIGKDFSYVPEHLHEYCGVIEPISINEYPHDVNIPKRLKICTWNIWGLLKYDEPFRTWSLEKRLNNIIDIILEENIDIVCCQEISTPVYNILHKRLASIYNFYEEVIDTEKTKSKRNRGLELLFLSKFKAQKITTFLLGGNLGYSNNLSILEFPNLVIFGCYLQAGSKYSPGQEKKWFHYSRCRSEQLEAISDLIKTYPHHKKIILGDINFHLDGNITDWPEIETLHQLKAEGFIDSFRTLFSDINAFPGYTEDTHINFMRYNSKFMDKQFRYDGIMSKGLKPVDCKILGINEIELTDEEIANMIEQFILIKNIHKVRVSKNSDGSNRKLSLWPSDHFGIMCIFDE